MTALVRTELLKLYWTRATWGLVGAAVLLVLVRVELLLAGVGQVGAPAPGSRQLTLDVLGSSGLGVFVITLLGVVTATREFRSATWTSTLLITPHRRRLVLAKVVAASVAGAALAALLFLIVAVAGVASGDVTLTAEAPLLRLVAGGLLAAACWAWLGLAVGLLVRHQAAALLLPLLWLLVVETLLSSYGLRVLLPWTPGGATRAMSGDQFAGALPVWAAALVLVGYAAALTAAGTRRLVRSDVC
ncbi:MAG TPA: ABC transporter permease [Propionibacteriaceae bacterium]|nr:ABC transporter permease [Propionibacteriaceae bacterium]